MTGLATDARPLRIRSDVLDAILAHAGVAAPAEACGGLEAVGDDRIVSAAPVVNEAEAPDHRYQIGPETVRELEGSAGRRGRWIRGFYHSHPHDAARPSLIDLECAWPWYVYLIAGRDGARAWRLREDRLDFDEVPLIVEDGGTAS